MSGQQPFEPQSVSGGSSPAPDPEAAAEADADEADEAQRREVLTGRIVPPAGGGAAGGDPGGAAGSGEDQGSGQRRTGAMFAGDVAAAAGERARQVSDMLAATARIFAGIMGAAALAGIVAAVLISVLLGGAFDWSVGATVIVLVVLALPAVEVAGHRFLLMRAYGDPAALRRRFTDLPDATVGRVQDFAGKVGDLRGGSGRRSGRWFGAARSTAALRGVAAAVPELTGVLLLPLTRTLLLVTAVSAVICLVLLGITPLVAIVALIGALAG